jgi:malate/lactate dehydrogenase
MVGAGNVGATTVKMLADLELASQIILVDKICPSIDGVSGVW